MALTGLRELVIRNVARFAPNPIPAALLLLPLLPYFEPAPRWLFIVHPLEPAMTLIRAGTYWPMRAFWSASANESYGACLVIGTVVSGLALALAVWLLDRRLLRRG